MSDVLKLGKLKFGFPAGAALSQRGRPRRAATVGDDRRGRDHRGRACGGGCDQRQACAALLARRADEVGGRAAGWASQHTGTGCSGA